MSLERAFAQESTERGNPDTDADADVEHGAETAESEAAENAAPGDAAADADAGSDAGAADGGQSAFGDPEPSHVTGPHVGRDSRGRFDHRFWRCERCGLETTDPRLQYGCFRCGDRSAADDGSAPDADDAEEAADAE